MNYRKKITPEEIMAIWQENMEDESGLAAIAAWVKANEGKRVSKRGIPAGCWLVKELGWTRIHCRMTAGSNDISRYMLDRTEVNAVFPTLEQFQEENACDFKYMAQRNEQRKNKTIDDAEKLAALINNCIDACKAVMDCNSVDFYLMREKSGLSNLPY